MPTKTFFNLPEARRAKIEAAAIDEFAQHPQRYASINAIVAKAGIAKGSFYQYFENLNDLYGHILEIVQKRKREMLSAMAPSSSGLDTFGYLRRMFQIAVSFDLREPKLASIERFKLQGEPAVSSIDPETGERLGGDARFHSLLTQGILHDDIATWVDVEMAAYLLGIVSSMISPYLIDRMNHKADSIRDGKINILYDPFTEDLFNNLIDIFEAGLGRDPEVRKNFFTKY